MYLEFRDQNAVFSGMFARFDCPMHVGTGRGIERVNGELVSGTYFPTLRVAAAAGRLFTPDDDMAPGGHSGRGALLRLLEDALCRRPGRCRAEADGQQPSLHGHRGRRRGVHRHRCRLGDADLRADDDEGPDDAGLELPGRPASAVRPGFRAAEARRDSGVGRGRSPAVVQGPARRGAEGAVFRQHHGLFQARVSARVHQGRGGLARSLRNSHLSHRAPLDADGHRHRGVVDRRCERRGPHAGTRRVASA